MENLPDRRDSLAEAWRPKLGDRLSGRIVDLDQRVSAYDDEPYPIVIVRVEDGSTENGGVAIAADVERAFHGYHPAAKRELVTQRPRIGERIAIGYHGHSAGTGWRERYEVVNPDDPIPF